MSLSRYTALRLVATVPVLFAILTATFVLTHVLPTNPAALLVSAEADRSALKDAERELGLDKPLAVQYWNYLKGLAQGDLGRSHQSGTDVATELVRRLPSTLELITLSIPLAFLIGIGFAVFSAGQRRGGVRDYIGRAVGTFGIAVPDYFFAIILVLIFYATLRWAPGPLGQAGPDAPDIPNPTGAYLIDAIVAGNGAAVRAALAHLVLPVAVLSLHYSSAIYRVARASMEEALRGGYIDYAVMMGSKRRDVWKAVISNALPPVMTITGVIYGLLLGGAVLVEVIFSWGGLGQYAVESILRNDYFVIQGFVLFTAVFTVLVFLAVDLLHAALDARVRQTI
jgi:peptide/nickel transport system permease protein